MLPLTGLQEEPPADDLTEEANGRGSQLRHPAHVLAELREPRLHAPTPTADPGRADAVWDGPPMADWDERPATAVDPAWLDDLDAAYAEPPEYRRAEAILLREHVVVLHGPARTGKTTTALRLLQRTGPTIVHRVHALDRVADRPEPRSGWLVDDLAPADAARLDVHLLRALTERLRPAGAYVVMTAGADTPLPGSGLADVLVAATGAADPEIVLERGLRATFRDGLLPKRVARLVEQQWVQRLLDARPLPGDVRHLIEALVAVGRGEIDATHAERRVVADLAGEVAAWFERNQSVRDRSFLLAAAVLQDSSFEQVDDAAGLLEREADPGVTPPRRPWRRSSPRERRLRAVGAHFGHVQRATPWGTVPTRVVRFSHPWLAQSVLRHLWDEHDDVRRPVVAWLDRLVREPDADPETAWRAAVALGDLGRDDVGWLLTRAVRPWAREPHAGPRDAAAVCLAAVAAEPNRAEFVLGFLRSVARDDPGGPLAAAAALTYGLVDDGRFTEQALEDLPLILAAGPQQAEAVARVLARLCEGPAAVRTLGALAEWAGSPSEERAHPAQELFLDLTAYTTELREDGQEARPLLLDLAMRDPDVRERLVVLWGRAWSRPGAPDALRAWLLTAQQDHRGREVMDAIVTELSRGTGRLDLLVVLDQWVAEGEGAEQLAGVYRERLTSSRDPAVVMARIRTSVRNYFRGLIRW